MSDWTMPDGSPGYVAIAAIAALVGQAELVLMTDRTGSGEVDRDYLVAALRAAQATVDMSLAARYQVPLAVAPDGIGQLVTDLARARLYPGGAPPGVVDAATAASALLLRISTGQVPLALPAGGQAAEAPTEAPVLFTPGRRTYPDDLGGY